MQIKLVMKFLAIALLVLLLVGCSTGQGQVGTTDSAPIAGKTQTATAAAPVEGSVEASRETQSTETPAGPTVTIDLTNSPTPTAVVLDNLIAIVNLFPVSDLTDGKGVDQFRVGINMVLANCAGYAYAQGQGMQDNQSSHAGNWVGDMCDLYIYIVDDDVYFYIPVTPNVPVAMCRNLDVDVRYKVDVRGGYKWRVVRGFSTEPLPSECHKATATPQAATTDVPTPTTPEP